MLDTSLARIIHEPSAAEAVSTASSGPSPSGRLDVLLGSTAMGAILIVGSLLASPSPCVSAPADGSPLVIMQTTTARTYAIRHDPAYQGTEHFAARRAKLEAIITPYIDKVASARQALGNHWQALDTAQKAQFVSLFAELVAETYSGLFDNYPPDMVLSFTQSEADDNSSRQDVRVYDSDLNPPFSLTYRFRLVGERWLIYDLVINQENKLPILFHGWQTVIVSLMRSYRTQFNRILTKSSYTGLVEAIEKQLRRLRTAPGA